MFSCPAHNYFLIWYWLTIFGTCVYHHEGMCRELLWDSDSTLTFDPKVKFIAFLSCLRVRPITSDCFDNGIPKLAHGCITIRQCVADIHDNDTILTIDLKVKFIGFMTWLCVRATYFLYFDIVILCLENECSTIWYAVSRTFMSSVWPWPLTSMSKL